MSNALPYGCQWIDEDDVAAVAAVLRGELITQGPRVAEFEARMAEFCGAKFAVAFSSGTAALHGAVAAAGVGPGDEVITSPLSFAASSNCAVYQGARPRFADVEPEGFNLDPARLAEVLTPKTKAVIPVDFAGHPAELEEISRLARDRGVLVIEDASHSLGAEYRGRRIGSQSDMTTLSFHPVKHITTGEGGMVLTQREDFYRKLTRFRTHGIERPSPSREGAGSWFYEMVDLGYNYRITDIQCALGLSQLKKLERFLARRREIAAAYDQAFNGREGLTLLSQKGHVKSAHHLYVVRIDFARLGRGRARVMEELREKGVGSQVHYIPIHLHPFYRRQYGHREGDFPWAEAFYTQALSLPMYPRMSDADVQRVIDAVKAVTA